MQNLLQRWTAGTFLISALLLSPSGWAEDSAQVAGTSDSRNYEEFGIGPTLKVGLPHPANLSLEARLLPSLSLGVGGGYFPITVKDIRLKLINYDVRARWHIFKGAFFLGGAFGRHELTAVTDKKISIATYSVPVTVTAKVSALYAIPHLGWFWTTSFGLVYGFELGAFIPFSTKTSTTADIQHEKSAEIAKVAESNSEYQKTKAEVENELNKYGRKTLPYLALFRIGWLF